MKNVFQKATVFSALMGAPVALFAANPVPWASIDDSGAAPRLRAGVVDAATGNITAACPTGFTCSASPITDRGLRQDQMLAPDGTTYIRTIVAEDKNVPAGSAVFERFATESYVRLGSGTGVSMRQLIDADKNDGANNINGGSILQDAKIHTGSFYSAGDQRVDLTQDVSDGTPNFGTTFRYTKAPVSVAAPDGDSTWQLNLTQQLTDPRFTDNFRLEQRGSETAAGVVTIEGQRVDIETNVALNPGSPNLNDQSFVLRMRDGNYVTAAGSRTLVSKTPGAGNTIDWVANDKIDRVLINETVTGASVFGLERLDDLNDVDGAGPDGTEQAVQINLANRIDPGPDVSPFNP